MTDRTTPAPGVTGTILSSDTSGARATATAPFGHALVRAAERNPRIVGLTADLGKYTDLHLFAERFPERFFQVGMAEQDLIGISAGFARTGSPPEGFVEEPSPFENQHFLALELKG